MDKINNILIVDNNPEDIELISSSINQLKGFNINTTNNIETARQFIVKNKTDIILANYKLPDGSGMELLDQQGLKIPIPVILMLESNCKQTAIDIIKRGAADCIIKSGEAYDQLAITIVRAANFCENIKKRYNAEHKLRQNENKYWLLTENINDVVWMMDAEFKHYYYISPSVYDFLGYHPDELSVTPLKKLICKSNFVEARQLFSDVKEKLKHGDILGNDINIDMEIQFRHKDNSYRWGNIKAMISVDHKNNITGVSGVTIDITDKKDIEKKLKIQEAYFETLIDEAPVAIAVLDNNDRVIQLNNKFESLFGYTQDELYNHQLSEYIVPGQQKKEGIDLSYKIAQGQHISFESKRKNKAGKTIHVSIIGKPVVFGKNQIAVIIIYQDISYRKRTELKTLELSKRLMVAAKSAGIGIWDYDLSKKKLVWESQLFELLGLQNYNNDDLFEAIKEVVLPGDAKRILGNLEQIHNFGGHYEDRYKIKDKNNTTKIIKLVASVFKSDNINTSRIIGACWDITKEVEHGELKNKVEIADQISKVKQQFIANMSHEIRSPLTGVIGMSGMLLQTKLNEKQKEYADIILSSSKSLLNIVNDILDLSKIEAGKMKIKPIVFNIKESSARIYKLFYALVQQKKLQLRINIDPGLPGFIYADEYRISQVITNLISNAVKFTETGVIKLSYILDEESGDSYKIKVIVEDTGIGISKDNQEKLFDIFTQADDSDTRIHEGTGLGLSISKSLVELMGGNIDIQSELGKGSTFWFTFMAEKVSKDQQITRSMPVDDYTKAPRPYNILLVEDKKTNQLVITLMLKEAGCKTDVASNGKEALEKYSPGKYDFILMDIQMPVMDGVTTVKELTRQYGKQNLPAIIGLSAKAMEGDAEYYISQGMDDYLTKPVLTAKIIEKFMYWDKKDDQ